GGGGTAAGGRVEWTLIHYPNCSQKARLYCFGTGLTSEVPAPSAVGPKIFVSSARIAMNAGVAAFDELCRGEAESADLPRAAQFKALVAPANGASAASRLSTPPSTMEGSGWSRVDGVSITVSSRDLVKGVRYLAPLNVT